MATVSAKLIKKPRKERKCDDCGKWMRGAQVRVYGSAFSGDPKYSIYVHIACASKSQDAKVLEAVGQAHPSADGGQ